MNVTICHLKSSHVHSGKGRKKRKFDTTKQFWFLLHSILAFERPSKQYIINYSKDDRKCRIPGFQWKCGVVYSVTIETMVSNRSIIGMSGELPNTVSDRQIRKCKNNQVSKRKTARIIRNIRNRMSGRMSGLTVRIYVR